jgi:AcrR family transcriptional regulator
MPGNPETHDRIIAAGLAVMRAQGLTGATTKEIAAAASLSEAALYKHFPDKVALLTAVVLNNLPRLDTTLASTSSLPLEDALRDVCLAALAYLIDLGPVFTAFQADPELTRKVVRTLRSQGSEPAAFHIDMGAWLMQRPEMQGTAPGFAEIVALVMFGSCSHYALMARLAEPDEIPSPERFSTVLAAGLLDMIKGSAAEVAPPRRATKSAKSTKGTKRRS